jgi:cobalamin synthase
MPQLGFETTIPVFERSKTVHALDRAATVVGTVGVTLGNFVVILTTSFGMSVIYEYLCRCWQHSPMRGETYVNMERRHDL